eukprot:3362078-Prymnesium_polylepis.1
MLSRGGTPHGLGHWVGDHVGDVQPSGVQLGARMSAQECSGALRPVGQRSFDFTLGGVNAH